jgi:hypothetical protein
VNFFLIFEKNIFLQNCNRIWTFDLQVSSLRLYLWKTFRLKNVITYRGRRCHRWLTFSFEYLHKFSQTFEKALIRYSGARRNWFMKNTWSRKSRVRQPLKLHSWYHPCKGPSIKTGVEWNMCREMAGAKWPEFLFKPFKHKKMGYYCKILSLHKSIEQLYSGFLGNPISLAFGNRLE